MNKFLTFGLFFLLGIYGRTQTIANRAQTMVNNMANELALSENQKTTVYELIYDRLNTLRKLKLMNDQPSQTNYLVERRKFYTDIQQYLTIEQFKKWDALRKIQVDMLKKGEKLERPIIDDELEFYNKN